MIQEVLLFVEENWVVNPRMGKSLGGVQTQVERRMTGQLPRSTTGGKWRYTSLAAAREEAGFLTMEEYVRRRKNMVTQYIAT